ncbi:MAG: response regulator [Desulfobulbaceae bacterium]|nr:response regulator [Desulfobulbaceae bacterium]
MVKNKPQANILVVDDQEDITWSLSQALSDDENVSVITAANGKEALDKLSGATINLLISDIMMLDVGDQDLFIEVKKKYPAVTVIVMTAMPSASFKKESVLGENLFFVEKPFDINKLKQQIVRILSEKSPADHSLSGIYLTDIIQLKCLAGATTTLQTNKGNQQGTIYFKDGEIIHAVCGQQEGEKAFFEVLAFGRGIINTTPLPETITTTIARPGMTLVREGINRIKTAEQKAAEEELARKRAAEDEAAKKKAAEQEAARKKAAEEEAAKKKAAEEEAARKKAAEEEVARKKAAEVARKKAEEEAASKKKAAEEKAAAKKEKRKSQIIHTGLKDLISGLSKIDGYIAAAVLAPSGKLVTHNSIDQNIALDILGTTFNTLFRQARKTSKKIGFDPCRETVFSYAEKAVIMRCSGGEANIHFHLMAIMKSCRALDLVGAEMDDFHSRVLKKLSTI